MLNLTKNDWENLKKESFNQVFKNSAVKRTKFEGLVRNIKFLKEYFHSPYKARVFCQECGSPIYSYRVDLPDVIRLRLGTVTSGQLPAPREQAYLEYKPSFLHIDE